MPTLNTQKLIDFNPRTYVRCDVRLFGGKGGEEIFQSTHLREVRLILTGKLPDLINISIHAPT